MIKILDILTSICVIILGSKFAIQSANMMFDLHLKWYFFENVPHLSIILTLSIFILYISSELLKERESKSN
ncbi:epilancin biosynthesis-related protein ElxI1 [Staphylococcus sp. MI 10-1553]|uniref:epilancin biosynthesis-related protein ElxI1 n=1 Tax=Staphylococcus sp. MI 10-1553 TaxID=1912064 RepID=UPI0031BBC263